MGTTDITRNYWYLIIGGFVGSIVGIRIAGRSEAGRRILDTVKLNIPVFRKSFGISTLFGSPGVLERFSLEE